MYREKKREFAEIIKHHVIQIYCKSHEGFFSSFFIVRLYHDNKSINDVCIYDWRKRIVKIKRKLQ